MSVDRDRPTDQNASYSERSQFGLKDYFIARPANLDKNGKISVINWKTQNDKRGEKGKETYLDDVIRLAKKMNSQTAFMKIQDWKLD